MTQLNLIGSTLGRFEILSELGRGGMAVVYKARQTDLDRIVALKLLPPDMTHDSSYVARFRQEARSAARLEHPHIMPVYEVGEASGLHYIAMKFIQGRTLKELVQDEGALSVRRAAEILAQVGDALDHAHRQGVIHRDIKPSNIMITDEGWVYLTDFGLARGTGGATAGLTMAGTVMGTPEYMSPEQAQGLPSVGPPTDIYALGVVLYELLTGTFPFNAETPMAMLAARLLQAPTPPRDVRDDLPPAVEDVVMRSLARKPEARFASSAEMVAALRAAAGIGATTQAPRPATPMGGLPAVGATIVAGTPAGGSAPPTPTPYVRPHLPTPPPQAQVSALPTPQPALPPLPSNPAPGLTPLPTVPVGATPLPAPAAAPARKTGLLIGAGAVALVLVLAVVGALALISRPREGPGPGPTSAPVTDEVAGLIADGDAALAAGDTDGAIESYQQALDSSAGNTAALGGIATAYNMAADWPRAEESANALVNAALDDDEAAALGLTLLADAIASQGGMAEAQEPIEQALELDDDLALAHAIRSNILSSQALDAGDDGMMEDALGALDKAVDTIGDETPTIQALTHNALAFTFSQQYFLSDDDSYLTQSEESYGKAVDLQPKVALFHSNLGYLLSATERYDEARAEFEQALKLDPDYAPAQTGIGWTYYWEDETDQAAEAFDAALKIDAGEFDAAIGKGRLAFDADDYAAAVTHFEQATKGNPRSASAQAWLGKAHQFSGFYTEDSDEQAQIYAKAEAAYRKALEINKDYAFAASGLGWVLQYQEKYDDSVEVFRRAIALDDGNDESHNGLAWSLYNLGSYEEAEQEFRRATEIAPDYASPHYGLGLALEQLGRTEEARAAYETTLQIDPDYTDAQEALDSLGE